MDYKFYQSFINLIDLDISKVNKPIKFKEKKLQQYILEKLGKNYETIKLFSDELLTTIIKPQRLIQDNANFYIACDMMTNTYYVCFKNLMMIDIDLYKDNTINSNNKDNIINTNNSNNIINQIGQNNIINKIDQNNSNNIINKIDQNNSNNIINKIVPSNSNNIINKIVPSNSNNIINKIDQNDIESSIKIFEKDVNIHPDRCWLIYQSKGGIHAFLISSKMDYKSKQSIDLMLNFNCDFNYIVYSYLRGWSVRLNRKSTEPVMVNKFIKIIGNKNNINNELLKYTQLIPKLIEVFKDEEPSSMYGI